MLVPDQRHLMRIVLYVGRPLALMALYDFLVVFAYKILEWTWVGVPHIPLGLYGSAIGVIVGFRNNSAYGRWWEGRQLWGQLVNNSRSFVRQLLSALRPLRVDEPVEAEAIAQTQRRLVRLQIAYVHTLRQHLRKLPAREELQRLLHEDELPLVQNAKNIPLAIQQHMGALVRECQVRGWLDPVAWHALDRNLDDCMDAQGGCERLKNTPIPKPYDYLPHLFIQIYCSVLPLGMVQSLGWFTPVGSTLIGFVFLALDQMGRDMENPFDNMVSDVPMTSITRGIEINLLQMLGEQSLPEAERPVDGVLW